MRIDPIHATIAVLLILVPPCARGADFDLQKRKAEHWAWQPVRAQPLPNVGNAAWPRGPIDRFVLAKLEQSSLTPAVPAERRTLIRRVSFDLTGLPPAPDDVDRFVDDDSPDAFAKVVDRLQASRAYGERWARHWMDLVRYAETYGHEGDYPIAHAWQYRDYLIRALNADVPYDQLVTEHIAGDLLPQPRLHPTDGFNESIIGTGFWFFSEQTHAPVDVRQHQAELVDNQVDTMGKAFLGLTLGCARCHDHKFDAISQKDVYSLWGFVQSSRRQDALLDPHGTIASKARERSTLRARGDDLLADALPRDAAAEGRSLAAYLLATRAVLNGGHSPRPTPAVAAEAGLDPVRLAKWVAALNDPAVKSSTHPLSGWATLRGAASGESFTRKRQELAARLTAEAKAAAAFRSAAPLFADFDGGTYQGWFVTGDAFGNAPTGHRHWDASSPAARAVEPGIAHSGLGSPRLCGVLRSPSFILSDGPIYYRAAGKNADVRVVVDGYYMDQHNPLLFNGLRMRVDSPQMTWRKQGGDLTRYAGHRAHIEVIDDGDGWIALDEIRLGSANGPAPADDPGETSTRLMNDDGIDSPESLATGYGTLCADAIKDWTNGSPTAPGAEFVRFLLDRGLIDTSAADAKLSELSEQLRAAAKDVPAPMRVVAMVDGDGFDVHVMNRGSAAEKNRGELAPRRFLQAIAGPDQPPIGNETSGRLELARRLTAPSNPLFARVYVNRIWHHLLGRGIVPTLDDFGVMGEAPTHPELLDYLAGRLVEQRWSTKGLIREVLLSSTYQMSSAITDPRSEELDPSDKLLHRARIRRLEGEAIRDQILAVSGRLDPTMFGQGIDEYLTPFMEGRGRPSSGPLDGAGRRSVYIAVRRNFLSPMMLAFDTPIPFSCMGRRGVSNFPAQALILLNDPFVLGQAELWAKRVLAEPGLEPRQRIDRMYRQAFARPASDAEVAKLLAFIDRQGEAYGLAPKQRTSDLRLWTNLAHALVNTKEFIYVN